MKFFKDYFSGYRKPGGMHELLLLAFPMVISTACDAVMTFTDRLFLAQLGPDQMNAALSGFVFYQTITFFFIGLTGYTTALASQYHGAGQPLNSARAGFQGVLIALVGWPVAMVLGPLANTLAEFVGVTETQLKFQSIYLGILTTFAIFGLLRHTLGCYFSGIGRTKIVMTSTLVAMVVNVVFDYLLIFGHYGFPAMGIHGAAYATLLGALSGTLMLAGILIWHLRREKIPLKLVARFNREIMGKLLYFGTPAGIELLMNFIAFGGMVMIYHSLGQVEATAVTIMFNWDMVSFLPLLGVQIAVTSLVGRYMGAGRPNAAYRAGLSGIRIGLFFSLGILVLFLTIPEVLVRVFEPRESSQIFEDAAPIAILMLQLTALYVMSEAVMVAVVGSLRGAGDTRFTLMVSVLAHWSFLPILYTVLFVFKLSVPASWMVLNMVYMIFVAVMLVRFKKGKWKKIKLIR